MEITPLDDTMADSNPAFREIESFNLFSQGNIYTTKVMKQRKSPHEMGIETQPTYILVGTLKPAKILNIIPKKTYTNESVKENENEDNVRCEYLQLDGISEADTELIAFHMLEIPNSNDTSSQEIRLESHVVQKSILCATSVKLLVPPEECQVDTVTSPGEGMHLPRGPQNLDHLASTEVVLNEEEQCEKEFSLKIYEGFQGMLSKKETNSTQVPVVRLKCLSTLQLDFIPCCLTNCVVINSFERNENILILSGTDDLVHGYRKYSSSEVLQEIEDDEMISLFPEFSNPTASAALSISFEHHKSDGAVQRWSAVGCQDGQLHVFQVDPLKKQVLMKVEDQEYCGLGGIHHIKFFTCDGLDGCDPKKLNLLVTPSLERSAIYLDIANKKSQFHLERETQRLEMSSGFDSVNACTILDIDNNGIPEIILGTYGQELLIYKYFHETDDNATTSSTNPHSSYWKLWTRRSFQNPILAINGWIDHSSKSTSHNDSNQSILAITTIKSIHFLQFQGENKVS